MRFLADESCDAAIGRALLAAGHDVKSVGETMPGASDRTVLDTALAEQRVLLTEDKDFGQLVFESRAEASGVILIRFPASARPILPTAIVELIDTRGPEVATSFVVVEPSGVRIASPPQEG